MDMVRKAKAHGCIIGSSSDRPLPVQQAIWDKHYIWAAWWAAIHTRKASLLEGPFVQGLLGFLPDYLP